MQKTHKEWGLKCQLGNDICVWCKKMCLNCAKRYNLQYNSNSICTQVINLKGRYLSLYDKKTIQLYIRLFCYKILYSFVATLLVYIIDTGLYV